MMRTFFIIVLAFSVFACNNMPKSTAAEDNKTDATSLTIVEDLDYSGVFALPYYGVIGDDKKRIDIVFTSIEKTDKPDTYKAKGKSRVKAICDFEGYLIIDTILPPYGDKNNDPEYWDGVVKGKYVLNEDKDQKFSGFFSGDFFAYFEYNAETSITSPSTGQYTSHGWNEFHGNWQSYTSTLKKECNWGWVIPPDDNLFSHVEHEFYKFNNKYMDERWKSFVYGRVMCAATDNFHDDESDYIMIHDDEVLEKYREIETEYWWK